MTWIAWALLSLGQEDPAALASRLASADPEMRAAAEAGLKALETKHLDTLVGLRERMKDVEARARLDDVLRHLRRRQAGELYDRGDLPGALQALAKAEGAKAEAKIEEAVRKLRELLPQRSEEFSAGGNVLTFADWGRLAPKIEPLLPWIYPELIQRLGGRPELSGNAFLIFRQLGSRVAPALCWAIRNASPDVQAQSCMLLEEIRVTSPLVLATLKDAVKSENAGVRQYAEKAT